jgi:hypothetical protein
MLNTTNTINVINEWVPIHLFRLMHQLPPEFGVSYFVSKDFTGRGSIAHAGNELRQLEKKLLESIPNERPPQGWQVVGLELQVLFTRMLWKINPVVGLQASEVEYAAAGFGNVIQAYIFKLLKAQAAGQSAPDFPACYQQWLDQSIRISAQSYLYPHHGENWTVRLIRTNYGLSGLFVETLKGHNFILDTIYICPAAGFMNRLLYKCAERIAQASSM